MTSEVVSATTPLNARARRQVEAEVGVSEEENPDAVAHQGVHFVKAALQRGEGSRRGTPECNINGLSILWGA
jgi:hypothetical protein